MKQKKQFKKPEILQELSLLPDLPILAGSYRDNVTVGIAPQETDNYDFGTEGSEFTHEWE